MATGEESMRFDAKALMEAAFLSESPQEVFDLYTQKENFDVILNLEIIEHVEDVELFLEKSSKLLKKDGLMFVATINKTLKSYLFAIIGAEYILRWLPIGTHDWENFVEPSKLILLGEKNRLKLNKIDGIKFDIVSNNWKLSKDKSINYYKWVFQVIFHTLCAITQILLKNLIHLQSKYIISI